VAFTQERQRTYGERHEDREVGQGRQHDGGLAGAVTAGLAGGVGIVIAMSTLGGPLASIEPLAPDLTPWIALGLLGVVSFVAGLAVAAWKERAGLVAATVAGPTGAVLLFSIRTFLLTGRPYNPLVFGWPGYLMTIVLAGLGGIVGSRGGVSGASAPLQAGARVGFWAACLWVGFELAVRLAGSVWVGSALGNMLAGDMLAVLVGFPVIAWLLARYAQMHGVPADQWEYRRTTASIGWGSGAGLLILALMAGTSALDHALWGGSAEVPAHIAAGLQGGIWVAGLFLLTNGIVVPTCEELAWRGIIQTSVVRAWGPIVGVAVVALLFALKHVVVDASVTRLTTLLMMSLVLGIVRHRWGTLSSTLAHTAVNFIATAGVIAASW
jgi:membrane protease YdiL (CAAX protease family)